jgi:hypothetical protein
VSDIRTPGPGSLGLVNPPGSNVRNVTDVIESSKGNPSKPVVVVEMMQGFRRW